MKLYNCVPYRCLTSWVLALGAVLAWTGQVQAQPRILSTVPRNGATGVSVSAPVVFTFSEEMDPDPSSTVAMFLDMSSPGMPLPVSSSWNSGFTVLTCTPTVPFPANKSITWFVEGQTLFGDPLDPAMGSFFTGGSSGDCTNLISSFTVAKGFLFEQLSASAPTVNSNAPCAFVACTSLACSNLDASGVAVTFPAPVSRVVNLMGTSIPGHSSLTEIGSETGAFEAAHPSGTYMFTVSSPGPTLQQTVDFPSTLAQPNPPHLLNYTAAQAIDPAQPFVLTWEPFQGGHPAACVYVEVYGGAFKTEAPGSLAALSRTTTSVTIPPGTLLPNKQYQGCVSFYDLVLQTNSAVTLAYRSSTTEFSLATTGGGTTVSLVLTNALSDSSSFSFEVVSPAGQNLTAEYSSTMQAGDWHALMTVTNSPGRVRIVDPQPATGGSRFYRVRNGF